MYQGLDALHESEIYRMEDARLRVECARFSVDRSKGDAEDWKVKLLEAKERQLRRACLWLPTWLRLRSFGKNRFLRSSTLWFVGIPVAAAFIDSLPETVDFVFGGYHKQFDPRFKLPFTWHWLYFASVCFTLASALFSWRCPRLISDYQRDSDFFEMGTAGTSAKLKNEIRNIWANVPLCPQPELLLSKNEDRFDKLLSIVINHMPSRDSSKSGIAQFKESTFDEATVRGALSDVRAIYQHQGVVARALCCLLYLTGFLCLAPVVSQQFCHVWKSFVSAS